MRVDVTGPQLLRHELGQRTLGLVRAEVHHHRNICQRPGLDCTLDRRPLRAGIVRSLDANDEPRMTERHVGRRLRLHVGEVLLELVAAHPVADDIEKCQNPRLRAIDDARLEVVEVAPARSAGVGDSRHPGAKREPIRIDTVVAGVRSRLTGASVDVRMQIDQAGDDVQA